MIAEKRLDGHLQFQLLNGPFHIHEVEQRSLQPLHETPPYS